jgi:uncharacterized SAM-binding protein YcdF (DUF218 family)
MKWLFLIPVIVAGLIIGLSFYLQPNDFIGCQQTPIENGESCAKADTIVVVSGGDTSARTAEGIALYKNGWADTIIFSGAAQDKTGLSNAAAMRIQALEAGVPSDVIYVDEFSEDTSQNAENTQSIFERHQIDRAILVTSGYHQRRANLEFEKRADGVEILNHPLLSDDDWSFAWWWLTPRGWWLAVGETAKIIALHATGAVQ